jgi:hypothetical protein
VSTRPEPAEPVEPVEPVDAELERDQRRERRLTWQELACLLFVAAFVVVRAGWLT